MERPPVIAATPCSISDPAIAIAACRAGALGILDLEYATDATQARAALQRLNDFTATPYGVKLRPGDEALLCALPEETYARLAFAFLAGPERDALSDTVRDLQAAGFSVLAEAISVSEAIHAAEAGVDGLILKGNESGGRVGEESAYLLVQHWCKARKNLPWNNLPYWVQGGLGPNAASACLLAGATGVVLDSQLLLVRESCLDSPSRARLNACDGSEATEVGRELGDIYRIFAGPQSETARKLQATATAISAQDDAPRDQRQSWSKMLGDQIPRALATEPLLFCGQDGAFAKPLAEKFVTVGGVLEEFRRRMRGNLDSASRLRPLAEGAPLAESHRTRFPLLQGPMTRVSDTATFATEVARAGGLPFLALALMRGREAERVITETSAQLQDRPWGVGILGFLPPEIRQEQTAVILKHRPPFGLIAGGRPDQARELEEAGIPTYLHVPSPGLLKMFLREGSRRFIFEGRECGGHVGPRSSFVLWETMCNALLEHLGPHGDGSKLHVVFAGGIHDALSSAMLACLAAPLAERGVRIGALMGTAYLFTHEAVTSGAIVPRFQQEALAASSTVLFETGPGHAVRCSHTPYFDAFNAEKRRLETEGHSHEEIVRSLEWMNVGRLRVASKGLDRVSSPQGARGAITSVSDAEQYERGLYMMGQLASLRDQVTSIAELHQDVCHGGTQLLEPRSAAVPAAAPATKPCDVAVIGMSALFPDALNVTQYWENILNRHYAVTEVPSTHWDWRLYYDPDPKAPDKIISKWGGFLGDVPFDPINYGITPKSIPSIETLQLLVLEGVRSALHDAGYQRRPFDRENTCTVLGVGGGGSALAVSYGLRACLPMFDTIEGLGISSEQMLSKIGTKLPEWTEDSFPGILLNVAAGRVANRFNFGGSNYAIDAACASSLAAVHACIRELELGTCNVAVAIGADTVQTPYAYMAFSKTHALSRRGRCSPFDADADGIVLSEGVGVVILKRLADAERDGDRIYAVIKGVGSSSDGMDKGLTAPNSLGQMRAIRRSFQKAGFSPAEITLLEAHGTGTVVGDRTEALSLSQVMQEAGAQRQSCAIGSVKSMIGHTKCAAGVAGLIKAVKAIDCKTLPPTLVDSPNPNVKFAESALYLNRDPRPWIHNDDRPRRAGVSSFGFGGTNVHVVLEEYRGDFLRQSPPAWDNWPAELCVWQAASRSELSKELESCHNALASGARPKLAELAVTLAKRFAPHGKARLAVVATSLSDLQTKLESALKLVSGSDESAVDPRGVYFSAKPVDAAAKIAYLFPGQGSQYPDMLASVAMNFAGVRQVLDHSQAVLSDQLEKPLGRFLYPPSPFGEADEEQNRRLLEATDIAQPAIGAASLAMMRLLKDLTIEPDMAGGHSYGEFVALSAANVINPEQLLKLSHLRGTLIRQAAEQGGAGGMVAIDGDATVAQEMARNISGVSLANVNAPDQTVLSGPEQGLEELLELAKRAEIRARRLPVACAFHSPLVAGASQPLVAHLAEHPLQTPSIPVFSNVTAAPYPEDPEAIRKLLSRHLASPVQFAAEIEAMYAAGARVFIEVGPNNVLTALCNKVLAKQPHLAVATDARGREGIEQLLRTLAQLAVQGVAFDLDALYEPRGLSGFNFEQLRDQTDVITHSPSTWLVNGVRSRPHNAPEPELIGTRRNQPQSVDDRPSKAGKSPLPRTTEHAPAVPSPAMRRPSMSDSKSAASAAESARPVATPLSANGDVEPHFRDGEQADEVMLGFQNLMAKFLETQREIMMAYLQGEPEPNGELLPGDRADRTAYLAERATNGAESPNDQSPAEEAVAEDDEQNDATVVTFSEAGENGVASANGQLSAPLEWDIDKIGALLIDLLSERTGYPKEMLDLDLNLEADLGIDSIKRVEILGGLSESLDGFGGNLQERLELEKLTGMQSLRGILEYLDEALFSDDQVQPSAPPARQKVLTNAKNDSEDITPTLEIQRGLVTLSDAPLPPSAAPMIPSGTVVLTDDGRGVARQIADRLADFDQPTVIIGTKASGASNDEYTADLSDPAAVTALLGRVRSEFGKIAGLIHCLPLSVVEDSTDLATLANRDVKSLYLLARELEDELCTTGETGNAFLLAATALGGKLGYGQALFPQTAIAAHGGILGFVKCVGLEWPQVLVRGVDLDTGLPPQQLADLLLRELTDRNGPLEVGYDAARRVTWEPVAAPLDASDERARSPLTRDATVLVTGGARGITAEIAAGLAEKYQLNLILAGSSPLPVDQEEPDTADLSDPADLKRSLMSRFESRGRKARTAEVETAYRNLTRDREIRQNLARMRAMGARVEYHSIDVRVRAQLVKLLADVKRRFGQIDGVIHGAGVIDDKLLSDKTPESFDRVFGVKVHSAAALSQLLDPEELKFFVFFASIASRYGNRGQSDYAAANEILSKLAMELDRQWPARVFSIAWGPWARVGMVADLEKHLTARGVALIDPAVGVKRFIEELEFGWKGESEVLIAGGAERVTQPPARSSEQVSV